MGGKDMRRGLRAQWMPRMLCFLSRSDGRHDDCVTHHDCGKAPRETLTAASVAPSTYLRVFLQLLLDPQRLPEPEFRLVLCCLCGKRRSMSVACV